MKILLSGVETFNKGAELMLYAILQEIGRRFPDATVLLPGSRIFQGHSYVDTPLDFKDLPNEKAIGFLNKFKLPGILRRLHLPFLSLTEYRNVKNIDYFIDGSGFTFSDQWNHGKLSYDIWKYRLEHLGKQNAKIIFLPQAFGPIKKDWTKQLVTLLSDKASMIFPRESKSYDYLVKAGVDKHKMKICTDFTSLVDGKAPKRYAHLSGQVCVIPNLRMVDKGTMTIDSYLDLMDTVIREIKSHGYIPFLLNHESLGDERLCFDIQRKVGEIEVVTGLNALEVKGVISLSYACISSRFHGVASALNSGVPCLATSWSHKYEELYKDYGLSGCLVNLNDIEETKRKIHWILTTEVNKEIRDKLKEAKPSIQDQARAMWDEIWKLK